MSGHHQNSSSSSMRKNYRPVQQQQQRKPMFYVSTNMTGNTTNNSQQFAMPQRQPMTYPIAPPMTQQQSLIATDERLGMIERRLGELRTCYESLYYGLVAKMEESSIIHHGIMCDGCHLKPIVGVRYKCIICPNFNLCSSCEQRSTSMGSSIAHALDHMFVKIRNSRVFHDSLLQKLHPHNTTK